jgi:hypothetical protein
MESRLQRFTRGYNRERRESLTSNRGLCLQLIMMHSFLAESPRGNDFAQTRNNVSSLCNHYSLV